MHKLADQTKLLSRVRRIKGQAEGLEKLLLEGDCQKVLQQIAAVRGAVNGLMAEVLEHHLREHLATGGTPGQEADLDQVVRVLRSYLKN